MVQNALDNISYPNFDNQQPVQTDCLHNYKKIVRRNYNLNITLYHYLRKDFNNK